MKLEVTQKLSRNSIAEMIELSKTYPPEQFHGVKKRKYPRWPIQGSTDFWPAGGDWRHPIAGYCHNLSQGGLGITCDEYLEPNMLVGLALHLEHASFHGLAIVRYCQKVRDKHMVGLEFIFED